MSDRKAWMSYVRGYPSRVEQVWRDEVKRIAADPNTQAWFAKHAPDANGEQRMARIQQAAATRAKKIAGAEFQAARKEYGVKSWRQDDLRAELEAAHAAFTPPADAGPDAADRYKREIMPSLVQGDVDRLSPYMDFDPDPQASKPQPVKEKPKPASPAAPAAPTAPAGGTPSDPVLAMLYRRMTPSGVQDA